MTVSLTNNAYGYKGTARIVGILYIAGTIAGALSASFLGVRNEPDYLAKIAGDPGSLVTGAILVLAMGFALALIPVFMFSVLRKHSEAAALGYLVFRGALETCTYIVSVVCYLGLASLGMSYAAGADAAGLLGAGEALNALADSSLTAFAFGVGALIFYGALYRFRLVPRWISGFGIVAALLHMVSGVLVLLGMQESFDTGSLAMNLPLAAQEMILAVWLIAKGIRVSEIKG